MDKQDYRKVLGYVFRERHSKGQKYYGKNNTRCVYWGRAERFAVVRTFAETRGYSSVSKVSKDWIITKIKVRGYVVAVSARNKDSQLVPVGHVCDDRANIHGNTRYRAIFSESGAKAVADLARRNHPDLHFAVRTKDGEGVWEKDAERRPGKKRKKKDPVAEAFEKTRAEVASALTAHFQKGRDASLHLAGLTRNLVITTLALYLMPETAGTPSPKEYGFMTGTILSIVEVLGLE